MTMKFHYFLDHFLRKTLDPSIPIPILQPYGNERFTFSSALVKKGVKRVKNEQIVQRRKSGSPSDAVILKSPSGQFLIPN